MKKFIFLIILLILSICMISCKVSNFKYELNVDLDSYVYSENRYLDIKIYLKRSLTEFGEGDNGGYSYMGLSPYKYKVYCDNELIYEYNQNPDTEKTEISGLNGPVWAELAVYDESIEIDKLGIYKVEVECNFKYTYTSKEYSYNSIKSIEIK